MLVMWMCKDLSGFYFSPLPKENAIHARYISLLWECLLSYDSFLKIKQQLICI